MSRPESTALIHALSRPVCRKDTAYAHGIDENMTKGVGLLVFDEDTTARQVCHRCTSLIDSIMIEMSANLHVNKPLSLQHRQSSKRAPLDR